MSAVSIIKKLAMFSNNLNYKHPIFRLISFILFLQEIRNGNKINKILLLYSVLSTFLIFRVYPDQIRQISNKISKLWHDFIIKLFYTIKFSFLSFILDYGWRNYFSIYYQFFSLSIRLYNFLCLWSFIIGYSIERSLNH